MTEVPIVLHYYYFFFFSWMLMRRWDQSRESGFSFFFRLVSLFFFFYTQTQYSWTKIITIIIYNNRSKRLGFYSKVCVFITTFELIERANKKSHETWYLSSLSFSPFTFYIHFFFSIFLNFASLKLLLSFIRANAVAYQVFFVVGRIFFNFL